MAPRTFLPAKEFRYAFAATRDTLAGEIVDQLLGVILFAPEKGGPVPHRGRLREKHTSSQVDVHGPSVVQALKVFYSFNDRTIFLLKLTEYDELEASMYDIEDIRHEM